MHDPKHDIAIWSDVAKQCHAHAVDELEDAECELSEGPTPRQRELLDKIFCIHREADEIVRTVDLEAVIAHLADPARVSRALLDHVETGSGFPSCCPSRRPCRSRGTSRALIGAATDLAVRSAAASSDAIARVVLSRAPRPTGRGVVWRG
jgi:hypothetical protein